MRKLIIVSALTMIGLQTSAFAATPTLVLQPVKKSSPVVKSTKKGWFDRFNQRYQPHQKPMTVVAPTKKSVPMQTLQPTQVS